LEQHCNYIIDICNKHENIAITIGHQQDSGHAKNYDRNTNLDKYAGPKQALQFAYHSADVKSDKTFLYFFDDGKFLPQQCLMDNNALFNFFG
jgi:hypothetical protein